LHKGKHPHPSEESLAHAKQLITESIGVARNLSHDLSLVVLREKGLAAALEWLAAWMGTHNGLTVRFDSDAVTEPLDEAISVALFQSARELLLNATKHAGVKAAEMRMSLTSDHEVEILVGDNGKGFDPAMAAQASTPGFGLFSIRQRLQLLGGRMEVATAPGSGSQFRLFAP